MFVKIAGRTMYLWRALDSEGEVLDMLVQRRRDKRAALRLLRRLLKTQGLAPEVLVTDRLRAYGAAARELGLTAEHIQAKRTNTSGRSRATVPGIVQGLSFNPRRWWALRQLAPPAPAAARQRDQGPRLRTRRDRA